MAGRPHIVRGSADRYSRRVIDPACAQNLAAVLPLLEGSPVRVCGAEASEVLPAIDLDLVTPAGPLRVRLEPAASNRPAFARSASLLISHLGDGHRDPARRGDRSAAGLRAARGRARSRGCGAAPAGAPEGAPLAGAETSASSWSRALFDRNLARPAAGGGPFHTAILVVVQPCEMRAGSVPRATWRAPSRRISRTMGSTRTCSTSSPRRGPSAWRPWRSGATTCCCVRAPWSCSTRPEISGSRHRPHNRPANASPIRRSQRPSPRARWIASTSRSDGASANEHESVTRTPGASRACCRGRSALSVGRTAIELHTIALRSARPARRAARVREAPLRPRRAGGVVAPQSARRARAPRGRREPRGDR